MTFLTAVKDVKVKITTYFKCNYWRCYDKCRTTSSNKNFRTLGR